MARRIAVLCVATLLVIGFALSAAAADTGAVEALPVDVPGTNIVFMRVRAAAPGQTLYEARALIWKRLVEAFALAERTGAAIDGRSVSVVIPETGNPQILVNGMLIVEVDAVHAALNGTTQEGLARVWADNLSRALDRWAEINR